MCTGVHELLWNTAHQVPLPTKARVLMRKAPGGDVYRGTLASRERSASGSATYQNAGSDAQGARCRRVLEYSRHRGTQRIRFRSFLLAALLYKIEKLGLSMHTDLHIDMSDVGLRRIE